MTSRASQRHHEDVRIQTSGTQTVCEHVHWHEQRQDGCRCGLQRYEYQLRDGLESQMFVQLVVEAEEGVCSDQGYVDEEHDERGRQRRQRSLQLQYGLHRAAVSVELACSKAARKQLNHIVYIHISFTSDGYSPNQPLAGILLCHRAALTGDMSVLRFARFGDH